MTTDAPAPPEKPMPYGNRALGVALLAVFAIAVAVLGYLVLTQDARVAKQSSPRVPMTPTGGAPRAPATSEQPPAGSSPLDKLAMSPPKDADELLVLGKGDEAMKDEPADLPTPSALGVPDLRGERQGGFRRSSEGVAEEFAFWNISGAATSAVLDAYEAAAGKSGFRRASRGPTAQGGERVTLTRASDSPLRHDASPRASETLIIRAAPAQQGGDGAGRVTLWFRYAIIAPQTR